MKILHTADWHIGQFKGPVVDGVNLRSQDTVKCLEYMVQVAIEEKPDIVCVSGDIFHQEQVGPVRYAKNSYEDTGTIVDGILAQATSNERELTKHLWDQKLHSLTHAIMSLVLAVLRTVIHLEKTHTFCSV